MNQRLRRALAEKCKDMGLTQLAIDRLAELGGEGLTDDSTQEDIAAKADWLVPFAAAMQGEVTRKTSSANMKSARQSAPEKGGEGKGEGRGEDVPRQGKEEMPEWAMEFKKELGSLKEENARLKAEKSRSERQALIAAKAKELGIPDFLMKRVAIADDADIEKELADYKQDLVNNSLVPKGQARETGGTGEQMKADALAWARGLPDK